MIDRFEKTCIVVLLATLSLKCCDSFQVVDSTLVCDDPLEKISHTDAVKFLNSNNIFLSSYGNCYDRANPKCTSLDQVNCASVCGLAKYKSLSGCQVVISAGTEVGHLDLDAVKSHYNGYKINIELSSCLNNYVLKSFVFNGTIKLNGTPVYLDPSTTNTFNLEGNHWAILFNNKC